MARSDKLNNPEPKRRAEEAIAAIKDSGEAHEKLNKLIRQPQLQKALDELHGNPEARKEASQDIVGHLKRKGVVIPEGVTVELHDDNWSCWCWCLHCACWYDWWWGWVCACWWE